MERGTRGVGCWSVEPDVGDAEADMVLLRFVGRTVRDPGCSLAEIGSLACSIERFCFAPVLVVRIDAGVCLGAFNQKSDGIR